MNIVNKAPRNWSDEQLLAWAHGEGVKGDQIGDQELAEEVYKRLALEGDVDIKTAQQALLEIERQKKQADEDLLKDSKPKTEPAPEPAPKAPSEAQTKTAPKAKPAPQESTTLRLIKDNLEEYVKNMTPGVAHHENQGMQQQVKLFRTLQTILRTKGQEFNQIYGWALAFIHQHRDGAFSEYYAFRYFDKLNISSIDRRRFERILSMMLTTSDPSLRSKSIKQVDFNAALADFNDSEMYQRVTSFYQGV